MIGKLFLGDLVVTLLLTSLIWDGVHADAETQRPSLTLPTSRSTSPPSAATTPTSPATILTTHGVPDLTLIKYLILKIDKKLPVRGDVDIVKLEREILKVENSLQLHKAEKQMMGRRLENCRKSKPDSLGLHQLDEITNVFMTKVENLAIEMEQIKNKTDQQFQKVIENHDETSSTLAEILDNTLSVRCDKMNKTVDCMSVICDEKENHNPAASTASAPEEDQCNKSIVFVNREDGSVNFNRNWTEYQAGFGDADGEFWLGLDKLHNLTSTCDFSLQVDFSDFDGNDFQSRYSSIGVGPESEGYTLTVSGYDVSSTGGDSLIRPRVKMYIHDNMLFSTADMDNDKNDRDNRAQYYKGGWWYNAGHSAKPTGLYLTGGQKNWKGINWDKGISNSYSYKTMTYILMPKVD